MGKAARRSVASEPLSPPYEYTTISATQVTKQKADPSFYTTSTTYIRRPIKSSASSYRPPKYVNKNQGTTPYLSPTANSEPYDTYINETTIAIARERERMEFFATYDVMTGVRIAATLGAFFALMVFLIVYKSRSHSNKALQKCLEDPKIAAVAAAVMQEEEDRELQEAFEATAFSLCKDDIDFPLEDHEIIRERMMSLGNVSAPPILHRNFRNSSISGYSSLIEPHRRYSYNERMRRQSTSESQSSRILSAYRMGDSFGTDDYFVESDGEEADDEFEQFTTTAEIGQPNHLLVVPTKGGQESRRSSGITCCSTESSFLERRCSAVTLGLNSLTSVSQNPSRRQSQDTSIWDANASQQQQRHYLKGPGIQVTQPTPKTSPCPSERHDKKSHDPFNYSNMSQKPHQHYDNSFVSVTDYDNYDNSKSEHYLISHSNLDNMATNVASSISASSCCKSGEKLLRRAPLASLSSFKMSSTDYQDSDLRSLGSDSVFAESYADTDDDMQQFSTDSDELSLTQSPPTTATNTLTHRDTCQSYKQKQFNQQPSVSYVITIDDDDVNDDDDRREKRRQQERQRQRLTDVTDKDNNEEHNFNVMTGSSNNNNSSNNYSFDNENSVVKSNVICGGCRPKIKSSSSPVAPRPLLERQQTHSTTSNSTTPSTRSTARPASHSYAGCMPVVSRPPPKTIASSSSSNNVEISLDTPFLRHDEKDDNSIRKECVEVNVIVKTNSFSETNVSPSVILELPIITTTMVDDYDNDDDGDGDDDEAAKSREDSVGHIDDPSIPGPSHRKWSKETLF